MIYVSEVIESIVTGLSSNCLFMFGNWAEIQKELMLKGAKKGTQKYPLIILHSEIEETIPNDDRYQAILNLSLYIVTNSGQSLSTSDRLDTVYKTVLYPIYQEFLRDLYFSCYFDFTANPTMGLVPHTKKDLYYYNTASTSQNKLNDVIDAIEIKFKDLKLKREL